MAVNFDKLMSMFQEALEKHPPEEWDRFVREASGDDEGLYRHVCQLLQAHAHGDSLLDRPAVPANSTLDQPITEEPGTLVGPYKLLEQIGEGGMGLVFMARQREPVKRNVALKVIKPGMDSKQVIGRFEAERQALALMDHPNIARVLDAGSTESGRPYFVMDLVRGVPITEYCDRQRVSTRERLGLFISICQAVQHAHQKGIIHRDLKPTNVLVTLRDGRPTPKVIDFGIAKATNTRLTEESLVTGFAQLIGTPLYMSPEQAQLSEPDVDTRSDVYSLGVLLYELLTGTTPLERETFSDVSFDELRRIIREDEPPLPSARLSTLDAAGETVAKQRGTDRRALTRQLSGELDWIAMKALDKDRTRRYQTAADLAKDVVRYLDDEPVEACPPSKIYRFRKFARRHRTALSTLAVVGLALAIGTGIASWQAIRATRAEQLADRRLVAEKRLRGEAEAQHGRAEAALTLAAEAIDRMLRRVARDEDIHGSFQHAEDLANDAVEFYDLLLQKSSSAELRVGAAGAYVQAGEIRSKLGRFEQADAAIRRATDLLDKLRKEFPDEPGYEDRLAKAYRNQGNVFYARMHTEDAKWAKQAEAAFRRAIEVHRNLIEQFPKQHLYRSELGGTLNNLATILWYTNQYEESETMYRRVLALNDQYREHLKTAPDTSSKDRLVSMIDRGGTLSNLAGVLRDRGKLDESVELLREAITCEAIVLAVSPDSRTAHDCLYSALWDLAETLVAQGDYVEVAKTAERMVHQFPDRLQAYHEAARVMVQCIRMADGPDDAQIETYRGRAHELLDESGSAKETTPEVVDRLAWFLLTCPEEEFRNLARAETLARGLVAELPQRSWGHKNLGVVHYRHGRWTEAIDTLTKVDRLAEGDGATSFFLAMAYWQNDQQPQARQWYDQAVAWMEENPEQDEDLLPIRAEADQLMNHTEP